jgi:hypothetical protein
LHLRDFSGLVPFHDCVLLLPLLLDLQDLLDEGNRRRKTEATDANAQSSRSHAVSGRGLSACAEPHVACP